MTDYQKKLADKVSRIFAKAEAEDNWKACHDQMVALLAYESRKSFQNGMRWAKRKRGGTEKAEDDGNDSVIVDEVPSAQQ